MLALFPSSLSGRRPRLNNGSDESEIRITLPLAVLTTALLFGGMALYSFGFAAFLFSALPAATASSALRQAFPRGATGGHLELTGTPVPRIEIDL